MTKEKILLFFSILERIGGWNRGWALTKKKGKSGRVGRGIVLHFVRVRYFGILITKSLVKTGLIVSGISM